MAAEQMQKNADESEGRHALKRRGLIAGAAALVAGMVAKQAAQPVAANDATWTFPYTGTTTTPDHQSAMSITNFGNASDGMFVLASRVGLSGSGGEVGVQGSGSGTTNNSSGGGVVGVGGLPDGDGMRGTGVGTGTGVSGKSTSGTGLYGESSGNALSKAVYGKHLASGYAVYGEALASFGYGVTGVSTNAFGVLGQSTNSIGVQGESNGASGIGVIGTSTGGIGVKGISVSGFPIIGGVTGTGSASNANAGVLGIGTAGPGVQGQSTGGHGLVGTTFATDGQHAALIGSVQAGGNAIALRGSIPPGATGLAGVFDGDVIISGALRVFGSPKNAAVKHPGDNTYRLLYCEESPESWFADYGEGTLTGDKAEVKLDADFAALVHADAYHVFLTAHGPQHLYVAQRNATGFTVVAMAWATQSGGPKAAEGGGTFSWRVVAKRKDIVGERLAKVPPPPALKPVTPFIVPETPAAKPPTMKP